MRRLNRFFLIFISLLTLKSLIFLPQGLSQEFIRNPFLTLQEQIRGSIRKTELEEKEVLTVLSLQAIFIWPTKKIALINGQILQEGELIEDKQVISIHEDKVVLEDITYGKIILKLPPPIKGAREVKEE